MQAHIIRHCVINYIAVSVTVSLPFSLFYSSSSFLFQLVSYILVHKLQKDLTSFGRKLLSWVVCCPILCTHWKRSSNRPTLFFSSFSLLSFWVLSVTGGLWWLVVDAYVLYDGGRASVICCARCSLQSSLNSLHHVSSDNEWKGERTGQ